jgi:hypothetical protein
MFPGYQTPPHELLQFCLQSYAEPELQDPEAWHLRKTEWPATRKEDLRIIQHGLGELGQKLGYTVAGELPLTWQSKSGVPEYHFFSLASAVISRHVYQAQALPPERCILVIPGSRVNLILYKLRRDPRLAQAVNAGWRFMKFRMVRQMLDLPAFNTESFIANLTTDPPRWEDATQLVML